MIEPTGRLSRKKNRNTGAITACKISFGIACLGWLLGQFLQVRLLKTYTVKTPKIDDSVKFLPVENENDKLKSSLRVQTNELKDEHQYPPQKSSSKPRRESNTVVKHDHRDLPKKSTSKPTKESNSVAKHDHQDSPKKSASKPTRKINRLKPRVLSWFIDDSGSKEPKVLELDQWGPIPQRNVEIMGDQELEPVSKPHAHTDEDCVPYFDWQRESFPTCNIVHEFVTLSEPNGDITYLSQGTSRQVWQYHNHAQGEKDLALKIKMIQRSHTEAQMELSRLDGLTLERMSKSPFAPNIYSYCANAQVLELAKGGSFHDLVKRIRFHNLELSNIDKLRMAFHISSAVADMHELGYIAHFDICCHQFLLSNDGVYQINDFHLARHIYKHKNVDDSSSSTAKCKEDWKLADEKLRAPEEYLFANSETPVFMDKVDVYMMGHLMYYALTKLWLFEGMTNSKAREYTLEGKRSPFTEDVLTSEDPAIIATKHAIENMCWVQDPDERPSARAISIYLQEKLSELDPKFDINSIATFSLESVPPTLPKNWRFTDSEYNENFYGRVARGN